MKDHGEIVFTPLRFTAAQRGMKAGLAGEIEWPTTSAEPLPDAPPAPTADVYPVSQT